MEGAGQRSTVYRSCASLRMKHNVMLTITSLLSILFMTFHLTDDIIRGMASGGVSNLFGVLILVVWLYGTLVLHVSVRQQG